MVYKRNNAVRYMWPPEEEQLKKIALNAYTETNSDTTVLVYWKNNPNLMIMDPCFFADTEYVKKTYQINDSLIRVIVGQED